MGMLPHFKCGPVCFSVWLVYKMMFTCIIFLFNYLHCVGYAGKLTISLGSACVRCEAMTLSLHYIDILTYPRSQNVSVNSTATFTCRVSGTFSPAFIVNMTNAAEPEIVNRGFVLLPETLINRTTTRSLMVLTIITQI